MNKAGRGPEKRKNGRKYERKSRRDSGTRGELGKKETNRVMLLKQQNSPGMLEDAQSRALTKTEGMAAIRRENRRDGSNHA